MVAVEVDGHANVKVTSVTSSLKGAPLARNLTSRLSGVPALASMMSTVAGSWAIVHVANKGTASTKDRLASRGYERSGRMGY